MLTCVLLTLTESSQTPPPTPLKLKFMLMCRVFFFLHFCHSCFETGSHYIALAVLEPIMQTRLILNSKIHLPLKELGSQAPLGGPD